MFLQWTLSLIFRIAKHDLPPSGTSIFKAIHSITQLYIMSIKMPVLENLLVFSGLFKGFLEACL